MRESYLAYAMSVSSSTAHCRRTRWPEAGASSRDLRDVRRRDTAPIVAIPAPAWSARSWVSTSARRFRHLRHLRVWRSPGRCACTLVDGLGQLLAPGDDPGSGKCALHRMPYGAARHGDGARYRQGHRRFPAELTMARPGADRAAGPLPEPAVQRPVRHAVGMATNIPPHNMRVRWRTAHWALTTRTPAVRNCSTT